MLNDIIDATAPNVEQIILYGTRHALNFVTPSGSMFRSPFSTAIFFSRSRFYSVGYFWTGNSKGCDYYSIRNIEIFDRTEFHVKFSDGEYISYMQDPGSFDTFQQELKHVLLRAMKQTVDQLR